MREGRLWSGKAGFAVVFAAGGGSCVVMLVSFWRSTFTSSNRARFSSRKSNSSFPLSEPFSSSPSDGSRLSLRASVISLAAVERFWGAVGAVGGSSVTGNMVSMYEMCGRFFSTVSLLAVLLWDDAVHSYPFADCIIAQWVGQHLYGHFEWALASHIIPGLPFSANVSLQGHLRVFRAAFMWGEPLGSGKKGTNRVPGLYRYLTCCCRWREATTGDNKSS